MSAYGDAAGAPAREAACARSDSPVCHSQVHGLPANVPQHFLVLSRRSLFINASHSCLLPIETCDLSSLSCYCYRCLPTYCVESNNNDDMTATRGN